jgi:glyoxylase-like metal-dependent hydrolase (beta-lactamase superfamily II)
LRAFLPAAAALALLACGPTQVSSPKAPTPDARPRDIPAIPENFAEKLIVRRKVSGLKMDVYETGTVETRGAAVSSLKSWMSKVTLDVPAFAIHHPTQGLVVFDTGLSPGFAADPGKTMGRLNHMVVPFEQKRGQDLASQLRAAGEDPARVKWVVLSHSHIDHVGGLAAFPDATVLVDKREWGWLKDRQAKKKDEHELDPEAVEARGKLRSVDLSTEPAFGAFDHGLDLFGDGSLFLVDLAGHTPGNMGLWANLDEGPVLLAGDASWILDNHEDLALPLKSHIFDVKQYWRRLYEMRDMQQAVPQLVIFPGHDLTPLKLHPRSDVALAPFPR